MQKLKHGYSLVTLIIISFCVYSVSMTKYFVKFTNVKCISLSDWLEVLQCETTHPNMYDGVINAKALIVPTVTNEPQYKVWMKITGYKLKGSKWSQHAVDYQMSFCDFMKYIDKKGVIPLMDLARPMIKKHMNFIHSCPFGPNETIIASNLTLSDIPWSVPAMFPIANYRVDFKFTHAESRKYLGIFAWYFESGSDYTLKRKGKKN